MQTKEYHKAYRLAHKKERSLNSKLWREKNSDYNKKRKHIYNINNREKIAAYHRIYRQTHKEQRIFWSKLYQYRKKNAVGYHTIEEWEALKKFYNYTCLCCKITEPEIKLCEDHVIPLTKGGDNYISNIQPLCRPCNTSKMQKIIDYRPLALSEVS